MMLRTLAVVVAGFAVLACRPAAESTGQHVESAPAPGEKLRNAAEEPAPSDEPSLGDIWRSLPPDERRLLLERFVDYSGGAGQDRASGFASCPDYLTRVESDDYCSADPPPDWNEFVFDGETYFVQPLARARY